MPKPNDMRPAPGGQVFISGQKKWIVPPGRQQGVEELAAAAGISPLLALLLHNRGVTSSRQAQDFLNPSLEQMHSWKLLPDIEPALQRLHQARQNGEPVMVHGDYDADGITATALLVRAFRLWGLKTYSYVPHRVDEGYGLSAAGIERARELGCRLMVTVDCGISDHQQLANAASLGLDVIVTDHHLPGESLPPALALINPSRADSDYPFRKLAGVGVAYKLAVALDSDFAQNDTFLQLAAVGTLADMVPLHGENRVLATLGLAALNRNPLAGLTALAAVAGCRRGQLDEMNVAFYLAPRLNAAGRMESPDEALELLMTDDDNQAALLAGRLQGFNNNRQRVEETIMQEALPMALEQFRQKKRVLVLHQPHWHQGVLGIVAARILHRLYRPVVSLSGQQELTGSARSIPGFDIHKAINAANRWVERFGGHSAAAGLTLQQQHQDSFALEINDYACAAGIDSMLVPELQLEEELSPRLLTVDTARELMRLKPFGQGNPEPLFCFNGLRAKKILLAGNSRRHLRMQLVADGHQLWSIGFGKANLVHRISPGEEMNMAASLQLNNWNGRVAAQLRIEDIRDEGSTTHNGIIIRDRRSAASPWLEALTGDEQVVWLANSRQALAGMGDDKRSVVLPPDNGSGNVYNLGVGEYSLLEAPWSPRVFQELLSELPRGSTLHLFNRQTTPSDAAFPDIGTLRKIYLRLPQDRVLAQEQLLELIPEMAGEPVLLQRILAVFCQAGLAREKDRGWIVEHPGSKIDLENMPAWADLQNQRKCYFSWLDHYGRQNIIIPSPQGQTEEV